MTGLRKALLWGSGAVLAAGALLAVTGHAYPAWFGMGCWALVLIVALLIERATYKKILDAPPGPAWQANGERFVDPESGKTVTVYEHPGSGRRAYVAAD